MLTHDLSRLHKDVAGWITEDSQEFHQEVLLIKEKFIRVAPQIKTQIIPDAGHDLTIVQAKMVNQIILEFLKQDPR